MDLNGITEAGAGIQNLPLGFGMSLAMNEPAMKGYAGLTEAEKEQLIMRCRDARTKEEMQRIVDSLVPHTDVAAVAEEIGFS
ncbi:MAG: hypothetical protein ACI4HQ_00895 [Acetatifactor sp.]